MYILNEIHFYAVPNIVILYQKSTVLFLVYNNKFNINEYSIWCENLHIYSITSYEANRIFLWVDKFYFRFWKKRGNNDILL